MKILDAYRLLFTPLSPLHIGSGESYEPTNYVIEEDTLYEFDTGAVVEALSDADRKDLLALSSRRPNQEMIKGVQKYFHERREVIMPWAIHRIPVLDGVASLYRKTIGRAANIEESGRQVLNRLEIDRTACNPVSREPLLFGSSLKGAIRTALLDKINDGAGLSSRNEKNLELQQRLFKYQRGKFELDPMRLVHLSDAAWRGEGHLPTAQVFLAVNRKKDPVCDAHGKLRASKAESGPDQILECVPALRYRVFEGELRLQSVSGVDAANKLPAADRRFDALAIARACNAFYRPILISEMQRLGERGYLSEPWKETVGALLEDARLASGEAFLLRVGRHSGAESVTLRGVRNIKITRGQGQPPDYGQEALTAWLAASERGQQTGLLPFGWLFVEIAPLSAGAIPDHQTLRDACARQMEPALEWSRSMAGKHAAWEAAKLAAEARLREEAEALRRRAEAQEQAARAEAEREARMATMSANMRRVEEFKAAFASRAEQLRGRKERLNADYHTRARQLAKDALEGADWTAEEKRAVADAMAEWLPKVVEKIDKDQFKKLKLAALRGGGS